MPTLFGKEQPLEQTQTKRETFLLKRLKQQTFWSFQ